MFDWDDEDMYEDDEFYSDIFKSAEVAKLVNDDELAGMLYSALCNMQWYKVIYRSEEDRIIRKLSVPPEDELFSFSWRTAGGLVADLRNINKGEDFENYMDWYCYGNEGLVAEPIGKLFAEMGWYPTPWSK